MLYRTPFMRPRFQEFVQFQQALRALAEPTVWTGEPVRPAAPTVQLRRHPDHLELTLLAAGLAPSSIEVTLDQGVLTIVGEREANAPPSAADITVHLQERFTGRVTHRQRLPDDIDPQGITARYADGALHIRLQRRAPEAPRRITVS